MTGQTDETAIVPGGDERMNRSANCRTRRADAYDFGARRFSSARTRSLGIRVTTSLFRAQSIATNFIIFFFNTRARRYHPDYRNTFWAFIYLFSFFIFPPPLNLVERPRQERVKNMIYVGFLFPSRFLLPSLPAQENSTASFKTS
jgi:hypothetical protein